MFFISVLYKWNLYNLQMLVLSTEVYLKQFIMPVLPVLSKLYWTVNTIYNFVIKSKERKKRTKQKLLLNDYTCLISFRKSIRRLRIFRAISVYVNIYIDYIIVIPFSALTATSVTVPALTRSRASARYTQPNSPQPIVRIKVKQFRLISKSPEIFSYEFSVVKST